MPLLNGFYEVRIFFEKRGRIKYISHLDTMRAFTRALGRSGLPLWYTLGFNPHLYLTFALPLSLGCEAVCESFDIRFVTDQISFEDVCERLNAVLPPGFRALRAAEPVKKPAAITWADYKLRLVYDSDTAEALEKFSSFSESPVIEVTKRTKKGNKQIDIAPHAKLLDASIPGGDALELNLRLAAGINLNINPGLYLGAFYEQYKQPRLCQALRLRLLDEGLEEFE